VTGRVVIVGGGLAGGTAARALREAGFDGEVTLVGDEPLPPYERPPLSKGYLRGESTVDSLHGPVRLSPAAGLTLVLGRRAVRLDADRRRVALDDGSHLPYDRLLVATGVRNRVLRVPGGHLPGVAQLRTVADADRLRTEIRRASRVAVVGMGLVGCEVAASLRHLGVEVVAVEPLTVPLERVLGAGVGAAVAELHRQHGVVLHLGDSVAGFAGSARVEAVITASGRRIPCDAAVVGVGTEPAAELVAEAGGEVGDGVIVDDLWRTSLPDVYAAGDVVSRQHPLAGRRIRVEHWQNAIDQGRSAARAMLGRPADAGDVPWFWSDQYTCNIQHAGFTGGADALVVRGSLEDRDVLVMHLRRSRVVGAVALNRGRDLRRAMTLIRAGVPVEPAALADDSVDLRTLALRGGITPRPPRRPPPDITSPHPGR
jgi:3-phenylpropionate/trans-cinnamate dioxygenase ferredoxin reductase component